MKEIMNVDMLQLSGSVEQVVGVRKISGIGQSSRGL